MLHIQDLMGRDMRVEGWKDRQPDRPSPCKQTAGLVLGTCACDTVSDKIIH